MSRVQLALNVENLDEAVSFYSTLFDTAPAKRRPGYANFAIEDPALKLVLFENPGSSATLNHLGVERSSAEEVVAQAERLQGAGLTLEVEDDVVCCYARQDKHWVTGPDGQRWENYVVIADAGAELEGKSTSESEPVSSGGCCGTAADDSSAKATTEAATGACCTS